MADVRLGDLVPEPAAAVDLREGVDGLLAVLSVARMLSSARSSCSDCADGEVCFAGALRAPVLVGFEAELSLARSSS